MEGRLLLKGCRWWSASTGELLSCVIDGATVAKVAPDAQVPALPGDWVVPSAGRWVTPGLVDAGAAELSLRSLAARALRGVTEVVAPKGVPAEHARLGVRLVERLPVGRAELASGPVASIEPAWHDSRRVGPDTLERLFAGTQALTKGAVADLVVWDVTAQQQPSASALLAARAAWVVVGGRVVVREGKLVGDELLHLDERLWLPT